MSRIVMTLFLGSKNAADHTAPVENFELGVVSANHALVGVHGRQNTFRYCLHVNGQGLREAKITLNISPKTGRRHEAKKDSARIFFNGPESSLWEQSEVGEVWRRLAEECHDQHHQSSIIKDPNTDFSKADSYMLNRPELAVAVMKELGLAAMKMPVISELGYFWTIVLLRERAEEFIYRAEFADHLGAVYIDVPAPQGTRRTALTREPFKWRHREESSELNKLSSTMPTLCSSLRRTSIQSVTSNALTMKRLLEERRASSQRELAEMISMSPATVSKTLSVLELPKPLFDILHRHPASFGARVCYAMSRHYKTHGRSIQGKLEDFARQIIDAPLSQQELRAFELRTQFY